MKAGEPIRTRRMLPLENLGKHLHADEQHLQRFRDEDNSAYWRHEEPGMTGGHTSWKGQIVRILGLVGHTVSVDYSVLP